MEDSADPELLLEESLEESCLPFLLGRLRSDEFEDSSEELGLGGQWVFFSLPPRRSNANPM